MGHPDQSTPDDHRSSNREDAPEADVRDDDADIRDRDEDSSTGTSVRAEEPDEERTSEHGHTYMGREMDDRLKGKDRRPTDEDDVEE